MFGRDETFDVIVVGTGLAGLFTALELSKTQKVLVLSKGSYKDTNSYLAQGGIAAAVSPDDSPESHYNDTLKCGHYKSDEKATWHMVKNGPHRIKDLLNYGVWFDGDEAGYFLALEGAHSTPRILRRGDHTGKSVMETLYERATEQPNITHVENAYVFELIVEANRCQGVFALIDEVPYTFTAPHVVLATGGAGHLFKRTTNASGIDGSGLALAIMANLKLKRPSLLQFHPTGLYTEDLSKPHFLISEAVRGEGAKLYSTDGLRFMTNIDPRNELAARDIVSSAIHHEMKRTDSPYVLLDATEKGKAFLESRFPTIYAHCAEAGLSMEKDRLPVVPCMHYFMGGIPTDIQGRTTLAGLYAVGECAYTGVHGTNRLASNSLLEALVFGYEVAKAIDKGHQPLKPFKIPSAPPYAPFYDTCAETLMHWMDAHMGIEKDYCAIEKKLESLQNTIDHPTGMRKINSVDLKLRHMIMVIREMLADQLEDRKNASV